MEILPQMTPEWLSSHLDQTPVCLLGEFLTKLVEYGCILSEVHQLMFLFCTGLVFYLYWLHIFIYIYSLTPGSTVQVTLRIPEGARAWAQWRSLPGRSHPPAADLGAKTKLDQETQNQAESVETGCHLPAMATLREKKWSARNICLNIGENVWSSRKH